MNNYIEFGIFLLLLDNKVYTAKKLAERFEVSTKTIYRHINKLVYAGLPITTCTGKNGGIMLSNKPDYNYYFFSKDEIMSLLSLIKNNKTVDNNYALLYEKLNTVINTIDLKKRKIILLNM